jgi:hypothetical protein
VFAAGAVPADHNQFSGTVVDAVFLGPLIDYQVDIGGLTVRVQGDRHGYRPPGKQVVLSVPISECVLMQERQDEAPSLEPSQE